MTLIAEGIVRFPFFKSYPRIPLDRGESPPCHRTDGITLFTIHSHILLVPWGHFHCQRNNDYYYYFRQLSPSLFCIFNISTLESRSCRLPVLIIMACTLKSGVPFFFHSTIHKINGQNEMENNQFSTYYMNGRTDQQKLPLAIPLSFKKCKTTGFRF